MTQTSLVDGTAYPEAKGVFLYLIMTKIEVEVLTDHLVKAANELMAAHKMLVKEDVAFLSTYTGISACLIMTFIKKFEDVSFEAEYKSAMKLLINLSSVMEKSEFVEVIEIGNQIDDMLNNNNNG